MSAFFHLRRGLSNLVVAVGFTTAAPAYAQATLSAEAQENAPSGKPDDAAANDPSAAPNALGAVVVTGRAENLAGVADSATQGTVGNAELTRRPILRPAEVLETVPGVIVTQHAGGGKANQYFLRGFNLDHGTDFATTVDGVPVNLGSHGHGQGYTDINWLIPELVEGVDYRKGPYFADTGDFGSAGAANIKYFTQLDRQLLRLEAGTGRYARVVLADSVKVGGGVFFYGLEGLHDDGPWQTRSNYVRSNGVAKFSWGDAERGGSVSVFGYHGTWRATDPIPERAISGNNSVPGGFRLDRFGTLDPNVGGGTERLSLSAEWHRASDASATSLLAYGYQYGLSLYSNFTGYLNQADGDEIFQRDRRLVTGTKLAHTFFNSWAGHDSQTRVGLDARTDFVGVGLFAASDRAVVSTVRRDEIVTVGVSPWAEQKFSWTPWLRSVVGLRGDIYTFDVSNRVGGISNTQTSGIASPKASLVFGPWLDTELYLSAGFGFHTTDARSIAVASSPGSVFARQQGAEVGLRFGHVRGLQSTVSLWLLDSDDETVFSGDSGTTEPSGRKGRRYGVEWTNFYDVTPWLTFDGDIALSRARFRDHDSIFGDYIPDSVSSVAAAGVSVHQARGVFGSVRLRYFGPRPLIEDNSERSSASSVVNVKAGYQLNAVWAFSVDVLNALNAHANDQEYFYASRLRGEPENAANRVANGGDGGYNDHMVHPLEPTNVRVAVNAQF